MDVILIPGFWLDASSWSDVTPALEAAGHRVHAVTLPGLESADAARAGISLDDHVEAVVHLVDDLAGSVVLVGHSGGGAIAQAVSDRRPDRVARVVYVDAGPLAPGDPINDDLPVVGDEIPLPEWSVFGEGMLADLDEEHRRRFRERAIPEPARVASDPLRLGDERRRDVPTTVITCEYPSAQLKEWVAGGAPFVRELAAMREVEYVDLPTGHWPQFTRPAELGRLLVDAIDR
ncbi:alpha/beta fold hydrolase [Agromyces aurantiacus]|uniref:Alpha/beta fold hydrolase n=1 Tax=Agromyces aurantiacus TaxID=165814 RepID=A0ABV9R1K9_9MICO|nr:alpha/beta hydrolase [Agromyces aurantiacus]MBM7505815.1 pimeloyl-ACP methyl ester carboxylesterase [Agromyces aurantiacus]